MLNSHYNLVCERLRPRGSSSDSLDSTSCWVHSAPSQSHGCDWDVGAAPDGDRGWVMGAWRAVMGVIENLEEEFKLKNQNSLEMQI